MRTRGHEIYIERGESFSIDSEIVNGDGSPFIVSSEMHQIGDGGPKEAYLVLTISPSTYDEQHDNSERYWLSLRNVPGILNTVPKKVVDFNTIPTTNSVPDKAREYLYYTENPDTLERSYKWYTPNGSNPVGTFSPQNKSYELRFVKTFTSLDTSKWTEQDYLYSIDLVSGLSVEKHIGALYTKIYNRPPALSIDKLYDAVKAYDPALVEDVDLEIPLYTIDYVRPILQNTSLYVSSNLKEYRL